MSVIDKPCRTCGEVKEMHFSAKDCIDCKKDKDSIGQKKIAEYNRNYRKIQRARLKEQNKKPTMNIQRKTSRDTSCDASGFF